MQHATEFAFSLLTIALAILAVAIFIYTGAHLAFYVVVVLAIAVGFVNAWLVSKTVPEAPEPAAPAADYKKAQGSRRRHRNPA